ncbi:MAG: septum formation family protein [Acidobacteria bacterium]|nr:septum formation family protein [Acidobacteriota bacterium]
MRAIIVVVPALALVLVSCTSAGDEPAPSLPEVIPSSSLPEVIPSLPPTTEAQAPEPEVPETTTSDEGYLWSVGDCVDLGVDAAAELPYAPYGTGLLMDCAEPHTHEVYFTATLSGGSDAPFPDDLNDRLFDVCFVEFAEVMGFSSSNSTLNVLLYLPDAEEWAAGERYHACVVYQSGTDASYSELVGAVADDPGTYTWQVSAGSCYDVDNPQLLAVSTPVDCVEEHSIEMIGEAVLAPDDAIYPGTEAIDRDADEACDALLADYAVQPLEDLPVLTFPLPTPFSEGEWDTGQRTVRCFAFASTLDQGLLVVVGSLGEGTFEIVEIDRGVQV